MSNTGNYSALRRSGYRASLLAPATLLLAIAMSASGAENVQEIVLENEVCRIEFDGRTGGLQNLVNRVSADGCLKNGHSGGMPFRIYADLTKEFEIGLNDRFQLTFDDPASMCKTLLTPEHCELLEIQREDGLLLRYSGAGLEIQLRVALEQESGISEWSLRITNTGGTSRELLAAFPYLDGVRLGRDPKKNLATAMDQGGLTVGAWERAGGVLGESNQLSMQWHVVWDSESRNALAVLFLDPEVRPKRLVLQEPSIALHHFPPARLGPGESLELPPVRLMVYAGDWRPAARAYRAWYNAAYTSVDPPEWFRQSNGAVGRHFKKGGPGITADYVGQYALESFRELPAAHIRSPLDNWELAFYSHRCMLGVHTDGDNIVREDMGGPEAMRDGIAGSKRLGLHTTLYVEGYIVSKESDLAKTGKAERWAVMQKDGSRTGPYLKQGFLHMCPGCVEWQDHLADSVTRLLRETGADGVRLDSLGFYYLPCYNPAHGHQDPFGYNEWIKQLLAKVRTAALAVNPEVLLLTEGPADWFGQWFHGALTARSPRDLTMMRLAVGPFRPYVYGSGALWGSLSGFAGGGCGGNEAQGLDWNWLCARFPAHEALVWGDVADQDPVSSDPEIVARRFEGAGYWAVVAARPASQEAIWPWETTVSERHAPYSLTLAGLGAGVEDAVLCDVEALAWAPLEIERAGNDVRLHLETNWALILLRGPNGPPVVDFEALSTARPGDAVSVHLKAISRGLSESARLSVIAPGLTVSPWETAISGEVVLQVPSDALPGSYAVSITGENILGVKKFLVVE